MTRQWTGSGPEFRVRWGGRDWTLRIDAPRPGLYAEGYGPLLGLEGLAAVGRRNPTALGAATLTGCDCRPHRVIATYEPRDWVTLTVRAIWTPTGDEGIDLEVQIQAQTVGELRGVEVIAVNALEESEVSLLPDPVLPRGVQCADLTYDGPGPDLDGPATQEPGRPAQGLPWVGEVPAWDDRCYVSLVHPNDESRRITGAKTVRHALFGCDLEKGVVLRGRLRGLWLPKTPLRRPATREFEQFVHDPLPLTTR